jgi:D-3-phosphoglycerate dehydrogenase / 2-oxoglutarate reductase
MPKILIVDPVREGALELFATRSDVQIDQLPAGSDESAIVEHIGDAAALLVGTTIISARVIESALRLKVVARRGVGYDNVDLVALRRRKIPLATVGLANATSVAEHTFFFILSLARQALAYDQATRTGNWAIRESLATVDVLGKTLLLVGLGRIGRAVADRGRAFGIRVLVFDPFIKPEASAGLEHVTDLLEALSRGDFVSIHVPLSPQTKGLIGDRELRAMKATSFLISTARGGVVDEEALIAALESRRIRGAALDVFQTEPLPAGHRLTKLDNVLLSPHSAALTLECANRMDRIAARNCLDAIDGHLDPAYVVPND